MEETPFLAYGPLWQFDCFYGTRGSNIGKCDRAKRAHNCARTASELSAAARNIIDFNDRSFNDPS